MVSHQPIKENGEIRPLSIAEATAFLNLAIGEGTFYYRVKPSGVNYRLEPAVQITMSEKAFLELWCKRLGVKLVTVRKKMKMERIDGNLAKFRKPVYMLTKSGNKLVEILKTAQREPFMAILIEAMEPVKVMVECGSFAVPFKPKKNYYSLIKREELKEVKRMYKEAAYAVPKLSRLSRRQLTGKELKTILQMRKNGISFADIGSILKIYPSTIHRALRRMKSF
ncbi:MAG: helix-turn-helix domain-containing protein [Candidatus Hecatellaceae archaeon]